MSAQLPVESLNMENEESRTPESNSNEMETSKKILDQLENRLSVEDIMKIQKVFMVAVAFTSKEICFYDLNSKEEFSCQYKLHGICNTLICMHYWYNPEDGNEAVLTFGDVCGEVNAICFTSALISLFERPTSSTDEQETTVAITWQELVKGNHKCCFTLQHKGHNKEWVRQVSYCSNLEAFISCATTNLNTIVLGWKEKGTPPMKTTSFHVNEGVNAFDYHPGLNLIASAALDHKVYLWNPYMTKPTGVLRGHLASVIAVQFNISRRQLFSFSKDKVLRIWDLHHQLCIQRLAGMFPKCLEFQTILHFNEPHGQLFTTFNNQLTLLEMKQETSKFVKSHEKPVTCVLYNSLFKQVISSDVESTVIVWMIETGQKIKQFTGCHGKSEITTMALDASETRFFTASVDGTVKIWDFNGHCHHKLNAGRDQAADISQILILKRSILILGWERIITVFRMDTLTECLVQPSEWKGKAEHQNDILCAAFLPPQTLVTGSYDGEIVVWNNNSEKALSRFHPCLNRPLKSKSDNLPNQQEGPQAVDNSSAVSHRYSLFADNEDNEFNYIVSRLFFLESRKNGSSSGGANLVACGSCGIVRFWNTFENLLQAEFEAHANVASIIMTVDKNSDYLITGDVNGYMKVWNIQEYCLCSSDVLITQPPPMVAAIQPHNDCINHLETCVQDDHLLILSASADCSIVLSDISGSLIGVFGQDEHWRIGECSPPPDRKIAANEEKTANQKQVRHEEQLPVFKHSTPVTEENMDTYRRVNTWESTLLGNKFRESRIQKRPRPRLSAWGKMQNPIGTFSSLHMEDLEKVIDVPKPDFLQNPYKYFDVKFEEAENEKLMFPTLSETPRVAFDEKSLFPKEILDREHKTKLSGEENLNGRKAAANNALRVKSRLPQRTTARIRLGKQSANSIQK
ncbi:cilia- and flagella-associated protein 337-like isoform X2 [Mustelus asterias]